MRRSGHAARAGPGRQPRDAGGNGRGRHAAVAGRAHGRRSDGPRRDLDPDRPGHGTGIRGHPLYTSSDANERRIVAHGFRNPFRWTFRPGTDEIYLGDVGNRTWEEIERIDLPAGARTRTTLPNFGWPCYEGAGRTGFESLGVDLCTDLYAQGAAAVSSPLYRYSHWSGLEPTGPCFAPGDDGAMGSSVTGLAFYQGAGPGAAPYPARYEGALFFADYSRNCLAALPGPAACQTHRPWRSSRRVSGTRSTC
jgi:hypothetical protein